MQFEPRLRQGLHDGTITVAFRRWRRTQAVAGHRYRTGAGMVLAESVEIISPADIDASLATAAGFTDVPAALADLRGPDDLPLYCVRFRALEEPDPRDELANADVLGAAELAAINRRLATMDNSSKRGPWTAAVLEQIANDPAVSSEHLAKALDWERPDFKTHVRRLKALGLTISLDVGYRLSPRGRAYLAHSSRGNSEQPAPGGRHGDAGSRLSAPSARTARPASR
jgi:biotin operon repressor